MRNFSEIQLNKVNERLFIIEESTSKIGANSSVRDIELFKDLEDYIYLSYICEDNFDRTIQKFYFKYDDLGNEYILNYEDIEEDELEQMFKYLERIKL